MPAKYLEERISYLLRAEPSVTFSRLTRVVLVGLLEVIKVDPATVNVEFVVNDSGLVGEPPTKVILWVLSRNKMDSEQEKKHSLCPRRLDNVL